MNYSGEAGQQYHDRKHGIPGPLVYNLIAKARADKISRWVKPTDNVFEFGVGMGWNLARLQCRARTGFDPSTHLRELVEGNGIQFLSAEGDIKGGYDVVIAHHVLEHVPSPLETLRKLHGWLRPGGRLLVFVPYEFERRYSKYRPDDSDQHLFSWTAQTAAFLIENAGFKVAHAGLGPFGFDRAAAVAASRFGFGRFGYRALRGALRTALRKREVVVIGEK
jgi:SAM-dependent methyltransferase